MSERTETDFNDLNTRNSLVNNTVFVNKAQNVLTEVFGDEELYETDEDVIFIEVQTGTYFGEDDIVRLEDDYDRREKEHLADHKIIGGIINTYEKNE